ncbi:DUF4351 domain-containing protein [Leptolyngbya sp. FACHB-261]|uniref:DUF4351 domain-containing protein n=1 Tax=Leptolyngbya sp. FACHB-261 TaxID=2692806 RepID=UPI001F54FCAE|nr:DUF4351 domain-containing protein [Leptolyngbya sp. FACHB-261]
MAKMSMERQERPVVKLECLRMLASLELDPARTQLISGFVDMYLELGPEEEREFEEGLGRIEREQQEQVMQIVTSWMRQGLQQGLQQGRQEGQQEGRQQEALTLILRLLNRRLGAVTPENRTVIQSLSVEHLEDLAEALLDFSDEADLRDWLRSRDLPQEQG